MKPVIAVNFKTYPESSGESGVKLAKKIDFEGIIMCVQGPQIYRISREVKAPVFGQHADYFEPGRNTGFQLIEELKSEGAVGSLLNHSEHRLAVEEIKKSLEKSKAQKFQAILCVESVAKAEEVLKFESKILPEMMALEIPELISTGKSITQYSGGEVTKFSELIREFNKKNKLQIKPLCGAGISVAEDVRQAIKLGCDGVLLASSVVKSKTPDKLVKEMLSVKV